MNILKPFLIVSSLASPAIAQDTNLEANFVHDTFPHVQDVADVSAQCVLTEVTGYLAPQGYSIETNFILEGDSIPAPFYQFVIFANHPEAEIQIALASDFKSVNVMNADEIKILSSIDDPFTVSIDYLSDPLRVNAEEEVAEEAIEQIMGVQDVLQRCQPPENPALS